MYYNLSDELTKKYISKISARSLLMFGRNKSIINAVLSYYGSINDYYKRNKKENELYDILWTNNTKKLSDIFSGSEFKVLATLLGQEWAVKFKKIWDRYSEYIYSTGYLRRSFRSKSFEVVYLSAAVSKLIAMTDLAAVGFPMKSIFQKKTMNTHMIR